MNSARKVRHERRLANAAVKPPRQARRHRIKQVIRRLRGQQLEPRHLLAADFGDAPLPYPTTLAAGGAEHVDSGPTLGLTRDSEADGTNSVNADADGSDEDGVTFAAVAVGDLNASVTVNVQGGPAKLDAWIDFGQDGHWGGPGEQIFDSVDVNVGDNVLSFQVPADALPGGTVARFRISSAGGLGPAGSAADGEVEDHLVDVLPPSVKTPLFVEHELSTTFVNGPAHVVAADIDLDGDMDALSASWYDDKIAWFENDGSQVFTEHVITTSADYAWRAIASDLDGDGDIDVLGASRDDDTISWFENDGNQNFTERVISATADGSKGVATADIDNDGDLDVIGASYFDHKIIWYENDGGQNFTPHVVASDAIFVRDVTTSDLDGDGDLDIVSASLGTTDLAWFENDGAQTFTKRLINDTIDTPQDVDVADIDGDGDMDVITASSQDDTIAWHENDGSQNFTLRVVSTAADQAYSVAAADIDGDGDLDLVSVSPRDDKTTLYENTGNGVFATQEIAKSGNGARGVAIADMDQDGDMDVVIAASVGDNLIWFENDQPDYGDAPAIYPTLLANNGPSHVAVGHRLGNGRDGESDGQPAPAADGDGNDDDGVSIGALSVRARDVPVMVDVQSNNNQGGDARLDAWIDFNADGDWDDPGEQVFDSVVVFTEAELTIDVPADAKVGTTYARFRLSKSGGLSPTGPAPDGEVEDYQVTIGYPVPQFPEFPRRDISGKGVEGIGRITSGDLDGDGDLDILTASGYTDKFEWFENIGNGEFQRRLISDTGNDAEDILIDDFDNDGDMDVIAASYYGQNISWYENDGNESFTEHVVSPDDRGVIEIAVGDVDGDGDKDFLSAGFSYEVLWYENTGIEPYPVHVIDANANAAKSIAVADIDSDGDLDAVTANAADDHIAWYENRGPLGFTKHIVSSVANGAISVALADIDKDGDIDVISASQVDRKFAWHENDGSENFTEHVITTQFSYPYEVAVDDFDQDGDWDIFGVSYGGDVIAWFENDGNQAFAINTVTDEALRAVDVELGDVDGDGDRDIVGVSSRNDKLSWYENQGTKDFPEKIILAAPSNPYDIAAADIDGDGDLDPVGASYGDGRITWYKANADGSFSPKEVTRNATGASSVSLADVDGDGDVDVIGGSYADGKVAWYENDGTGEFAEHLVSENADGVNDVAVADVDGDGDLDLLSASGQDNKIAWYQNDGNENFAERVVSTNASLAYAVAVGDLDGDGDMDIASASYDDDKVAWYQNDGNENFTEIAISTEYYGPSRVKLIDMDGDGDLDVLVNAQGDEKLIWHENDGAGNFTARVITDYISYPYTLEAGDLDQDGDIDVVSVSSDDEAIVAYENDGTLQFTKRILSDGVDRTLGLKTVDLDGDGDLDVLSAQSSDGEFVWYQNIGTDLGDAPDTYPTLLADDGATHKATGPRLGDSRDGEPNATPTTNANGDGDDEDGVLFGTLKLGQAMAGINIDLQAADSAKVDAWIDFDASGTWESDEQILDSVDVSAGLQTLNYTVPATITLGATYARVRVSSQGDLEPHGLADDGEVEDYVVVIREDVAVDVPGPAGDVTVQRNGTNIEVIDNANGAVTLATKAIETTQMLELNGTSQDDAFRIDFAQDGFFAFPDGVSIAGDTGEDSVTVHGNAATTATLQSSGGPLSGATILVEHDSTINEIAMTAKGPISISGMQTIGIDGALKVGGQSLTLSAADPIVLGTMTEFEGGSIQSGGTVQLSGSLKYRPPTGTTPAVGDSFVLISATSVTGSFVSMDLPAPPLGADWSLSEGPTEVKLTLVDLAQVNAFGFGDGSQSSQRSQITTVEVEFDGLVDVDTDAFELRKRGPEGGVVETSFSIAPNGGGNSVATLTFSGAFTRGASYALVDGNYELSVDPTKVRRAGTVVQLDGDHDGLQGGGYLYGDSAIDQFFAFYGDSDGDRDVDGQDYGRFGLSFLKTQADDGFNSAFDSDGDGDVDGQDYGRFGQRFLKTLPF